MTADDRPLVETTALTKRYGSAVLAVDRLDLRVRRGTVHGFLGPNGAGKTTTLRMLAGLIRPSGGAATVAGFPAGDPRSLARTGIVVDEAAFYPHLSGRDNLRFVARCIGLPEAAADRGLAWVGLAPAARFRVKAYSTGMKQRLALGAALMKDPELLILDEPSNGLDPEGMSWLRQLLRSFAGEGRSVLVSSHLLAEVEQTCDHVSIIQTGRLLHEGPVEGLRTGTRLVVGAAPTALAARLLQDLLGSAAVEAAGDRLLVTASPERAAEINRHLVTNGVAVSELHRQEESLEAAFLKLTGEEGAAPPAGSPTLTPVPASVPPPPPPAAEAGSAA